MTIEQELQQLSWGDWLRGALTFVVPALVILTASRRLSDAWELHLWQIRLAQMSTLPDRRLLVSADFTTGTLNR
jgi:hypothetical protein